MVGIYQWLYWHRFNRQSDHDEFGYVSRCQFSHQDNKNLHHQNGCHYHIHLGVWSSGHDPAVSGLERIRPRRLRYQLLSQLGAGNEGWSGVQYVADFYWLRAATVCDHFLLLQNLQVNLLMPLSAAN